jgi:CheY-like chemotaxis protein
MTDLPRIDAPLGSRLPLRILLVDDEAVNRRVMLRLLDRFGYRADAAEDGALAVEAARATPYDLILMDLQMPVLDGAEAARRIRAASPAGSHPRIVALTAADAEESRAACLAAGMDDVLTKPVAAADLEATLLRAAGGRRGARRAAPS